MKELAGGSYDEKDTVSAVKKARAGEQQQLNIERIKAEIAAENEKVAEENKENLTKNISNNESEIGEDTEDVLEVDEEIDEIEESITDGDSAEEEIIEEVEEEALSPSDRSPNREQNSEDSENISSLRGERDHEVVEDLNSPAKPQKDGDEGVESENNPITDENQIFVITSENLPFSKMKQLMTIVS
ncbi:hypothetical protein IKO50_03890 [bacterium]|nr:hypothetical protein [bacterium]